MKKSKSKAGSPQGSLERRFVAIHQDDVLESLASGLVRLDGRLPMEAGAIDGAQLSSAAHGFSYGAVGLLELSPTAGSNDELGSDCYVPLSECEALWLRTQEELDEIEVLIPSFGDTVPAALALRMDASLFEAAPAKPAPAGSGELFGEAPVAGAPQDASDPADGSAVGSGALVERIAGAISMLRKRVLEKGMAPSHLVNLLSVGMESAQDGASPLHRLVSGVLQVARPDGEATEDAQILQAVAAQLVQTDSSEGMDPETFLGLLHGQIPENEADEALRTAVESLQSTVRKIVGNQIMLSENRIDDSGQVGLRGIMVFFLAPSPVFLSRWLKARPEVGDGVSLVASMLVGLFVGHGRIPAEQKGPGKEAFLSTVRIAADVVSGGGGVASSRSWDAEASRVERIIAGGMEFAAVVEPAPERVSTFISLARKAGIEPKVDPSSGGLSIQGQAGDQVFPIGVEIGPSVWLPASATQVAVFQVVARPPGRRQLTKNVLADLLSPSMPPVWAALGGSPNEVSLLIEVGLEEAASLGPMVAELGKRMVDLGLIPSVPVERKKIARKRASKKKVKPEESQ